MPNIGWGSAVGERVRDAFFGEGVLLGNLAGGGTSGNM